MTHRLRRAAWLLLIVFLALLRPVGAQNQLINGGLVVVGPINGCDATGGTNAYTCTFDPPIAEYNTKVVYTFTANSANTGPATLNLNGVGVTPIVKVQGAITTPLAANDIRAGQIVLVTFDGTNMQMVSQLGNAPAAMEVFNVKVSYGGVPGALGNGIANDTAAIQAAYAAIPATGGTLYFPPGTYLLDPMFLTKNNVTWLGAGARVSILQTPPGTASTYMIQPSVTTLTNVTFEHLGLDGANLVMGWYADDPSRNGLLTVRGCRFTRFTSWTLYITAPHFVVDRNEFEGDGTTATQSMQSIILSLGASHGTVTHNTFRYVRDGLFGKAGGYNLPITHGDMLSYVEYSGNFTDLGVYTRSARATNLGTVTYGDTTLTDSGATFGGFGGPTDFVRVMPLRASGTATIAGTKLTDAAANFTAVLPGELVRIGGKIGIVTEKESSTVLHVEEWLSDTDRSRGGHPASGLPYDVWGVYLGKYAGHTGQTITVGRWMTLNGTTIPGASIPTNTRYELLPHSPNYAFHCEYSCQHWKITNNTVLRPYSDGLSWYGSYGVIAHNIVGWGQDVGITINGLYNLVTSNRVTHQGTYGIACDKCSDCVISHNSITDTTWENTFDGYVAGISIVSGDRNIISHNSIGVDSVMPFARYGIAVAGNAANNLLLGNSTRNHGVAGLRLDHAEGVVSNTYYLNNISINETAVSTAGPTFSSSPLLPPSPVTTITPTAPNRTIAVVVNGVTLYVPARTTND